MKLVTALALLAWLAIQASSIPACARPATIRPDLASIAGRSTWTVTHASAEVATDTAGKTVVHLDADGDSNQGLVGLATPVGLRFTTGTIEIDLKGKDLRGQSFLGVAFNVVDERTFEAIYFRPFNFKADPPFRSRAVQYISWPDSTWEHLRKTAPGQFEQPVNPVPDPNGWFHASIEVSSSQVRVFVNHAKEPSLVVKRLSSGALPRPAGLFVDSADGEYANLLVMPD